MADSRPSAEGILVRVRSPDLMVMALPVFWGQSGPLNGETRCPHSSDAYSTSPAASKQHCRTRRLAASVASVAITTASEPQDEVVVGQRGKNSPEFRFFV